MLFRDDETWLRGFTAKYCNKRSVSEIGGGDLKKWARLTDESDGQHLAKHMAPDLWGGSVASLQTAYAIIGLFAPARIRESDAYQRAWAALGHRIVRETRKLGQAKGKPFTLRPRPKKKQQ